MIQLTRINHTPLVLNSDLIEHIEVTPDTVISLVTGQKIRVRETADEVIDKVIQFRRSICGLMPCASTYRAAVLQPPEDETAEGNSGDELSE